MKGELSYGSGATRASRSKLANCPLRPTGGLLRGSIRSDLKDSKALLDILVREVEKRSW